MAAFSLRNKKNKEPEFGFGQKSSTRNNEKDRPSSTDPDETQIPGSEKDPSQTVIQPNAQQQTINRRNGSPARAFRSKMKEAYLRSKALVGVWNVAVF